MPKVRIQAGAELDVLSKAELSDAFRQRDAERDRARTVKWMELAFPVTPAALTAFVDGPAEGFTWSVKLVSAVLASSGTLLVYKASSAGSTARLIGAAAAGTNQVITWSSSQAILFHGQGLYLVASQNLTQAYVSAVQAAAELAYRAFD